MENISAVLAGIQQSILQNVEAYWISNQQPEVARKLTNQEPAKPTPEPKKQRSPVGWIEERWGNKSRSSQSLSLYYCYYASEYELTGEGSTRRNQKQRIYLQTHQCQEISKMVHGKRPYTEILTAIGRTKHHSNKPHHTQEPKI